MALKQHPRTTATGKGGTVFQAWNGNTNIPPHNITKPVAHVHTHTHTHTHTCETYKHVQPIKCNAHALKYTLKSRTSTARKRKKRLHACAHIQDNR